MTAVLGHHAPRGDLPVLFNHAVADPNERLHLFSYSHDVCDGLAQQIIQEQCARLPDLSQVVVLVPELQGAAHLRRQLLDHAQQRGYRALLGPHISTLNQWITTNALPHRPPMNTHGRELMLIEAMREHSHLFGDTKPWAISDSLMALFDDLTLNRVELPNDPGQFISQLVCAYGEDSTTLLALSREALLVHTLWRAYHQQMLQEGSIDAASAYLQNLQQTLCTLPAKMYFYVAGFHQLIPGERDWIMSLMERRQLRMVIQGGLTPPPAAVHDQADTAVHALAQQLGNAFPVAAETQAFSQFLDAIFAPFPCDKSSGNDRAVDMDAIIGNTPSLAQRANAFAARHPHSPALQRLGLFSAKSAEQEARAVDLQVRRWLLDGKQHIGIVTADRRLARRIRALQERAGIILQDRGGWALSTTSAATALERWLQTVEQDFAHHALLDLLKSPFVFPHLDRDTRLQKVYRLEHHVIMQGNLPQGLARYRKRLLNGDSLLPRAKAEELATLLGDLEQAAQPLLPLVDDGAHATTALLQALQESLARLGMLAAWADDGAGDCILKQLATMRQAARGRHLSMDWLEFRIWLGRNLERYHFRPASASEQVQLLDLHQTTLSRFDAVIIAGADQDHLPGTTTPSPFFNDGVRHELGLPTTRHDLSAHFHLFRRLLECAPQVVITTRMEQDGEGVMASPWVEAIQTFHHLAYGRPLIDEELTRLVTQPGTQISQRDDRPHPTPQTAPAPVADPSLIPDTVSASAYQSLMDCPYQYYASYCLGLAPPEKIREVLEKSDYGMRVHRILQRFHQQLATRGHPPEPKSRQLLETISHTVFSQDIDNNFAHRAWLRRWLDLIPKYLAWQSVRAQEWQTVALEAYEQVHHFGEGWHIKGQLDRVDHCPEGVGIIDYKTGAIPQQAMVTEGEVVQLPFYALLYPVSVQRVEYLSLDKNTFGSRVALEGEALATLSTQVGQRLKVLIQALADGTPLPAWGDEETCSRCAMEGLCRKQAWSETEIGAMELDPSTT